jgi:hypothetical protein
VLAGALGCDKVYADPITESVGVRPDAGLTSPPIEPVLCPPRAVENSPCSRASTVCEYGQSPDPSCNTVFVCAVDPSYGTYWTEQRRGSCSATCPEADAIVDGAPCDLGDAGSVDDAELQCATPRGNCACTTGPDGEHAHPRRWVCTKPADGCPDARPLLGQPCVGDHECDYGACAAKRGTLMICASGVWQIEAASCP